MKIEAKVVADSLSPQGNRLTSVLVTFPSIILPEINTHRMLVKSTSSLRAIPFNKIVEKVMKDPFIPIAWQMHHQGMQGDKYITDQYEINTATSIWLVSRDKAVEQAIKLYEKGNVTKQIANRLLEPFTYRTMLITGSEYGWNVFFKLRSPKYINSKGEVFRSKKEYISKEPTQGNENLNALDWLQRNIGQAEIHFMALAESIHDAMSESLPKQLNSGDWHIPFIDSIDTKHFLRYRQIVDDLNEIELSVKLNTIKLSVGLTAQISYDLIKNIEVSDYDRLINLHDRLIVKDPLHAVPFEHCAQAMDKATYYRHKKGDENGWLDSYRGFTSYRYMVEKNEPLYHY